MMNHVVLIGEITETNEHGVCLQIDDKTNIQVNLSPLFQDILTEYEVKNPTIAIRGQLVIGDDKQVAVRADLMQFCDREKKILKPAKRKDISR